MPSQVFGQSSNATKAAAGQDSPPLQPSPVEPLPDEVVELLARLAKEWLTFERLRQELLNLGAPDPLLVSTADRDVGAVTRSLLAPTRGAEEVERVKYALLRALSAHPDIARLRFQAEPDMQEHAAGA